MASKIIILAALVAIVAAELPVQKNEEKEYRPRSPRGIVTGLSTLGAAKFPTFPNFPGFTDIVKSFVCSENTQSAESWSFLKEIGNLFDKAALCPLDLLSYFCPGCTESVACSRPAEVSLADGLKNLATLILQKL